MCNNVYALQIHEKIGHRFIVLEKVSRKCKFKGKVMMKTTSDWDCRQHSFDCLVILKETEASRLFLCAQQ